MTLCEMIETLAQAHVDDELAAAERHELALHVRSCESCRARVAEEERTVGRLRRRLAVPPAPAPLRTRLAGELDADDSSDRAVRRVELLAVAAVTLAIAAIALFALLVLSP